jgi:hypothetical protein
MFRLDSNPRLGLGAHQKQGENDEKWPLEGWSGSASTQAVLI